MNKTLDKADNTTNTICLALCVASSLMVSGCVQYPVSGATGYHRPPASTDESDTGMQAQQIRINTTVAAGTEIPFSKLMQPAFASDYRDCDIITVAEFVASGLGAWATSYPLNEKVVFRCLPPGVAGEKNPLSGEVKADFVSIPKEKSDLVFSLRPGDLVRLRGGTFVSKIHPMSTYTEIFFEATSIEKYVEAKGECQTNKLPAAPQAISNAPQETKVAGDVPPAPVEPTKSPADDMKTTAPKPPHSGALDDLLR